MGSNIGDTVIKPRIMLSPSDTEWPFRLRQRQFPLTLAFALTINKKPRPNTRKSRIISAQASIHSWTIICSTIQNNF